MTEPIRVLIGMFDGVGAANAVVPALLSAKGIFARRPDLDCVIVGRGPDGNPTGNRGGHYPEILDVLETDTSAIVLTVEDEWEAEAEAELRRVGAKIHYTQLSTVWP